MESDSVEMAHTIKVMLAQSGFNFVEVINDTQINPNTVLVVTRAGGDEMKQALTQVFAKTYHVASESATLTDDSDFAASILVGNNALLK
jgi:ABC-type phosphate/phosphonate transport system substrate-binding protein